MSFTASFTAYQRVGVSRRSSERTGPESHRPGDPLGGVEVIAEGPGPDGGPPAV